MLEFTLPDLPYDYFALEPHISGQIIQLHHDKHHRAYVEGANAAVSALADARKEKDFTRISALEQALAFNLSGHILHSIYWRNLTPKGGGKPDGELAEMIKRDFGRFEAFKHQMIEAAMTTMGSGWAALAFEPISGRLFVTQLHDHQSATVQGALPMMVLDAWEHAWYLQYRADKKAYFEAIWELWNWEDIAGRLATTRAAHLYLSDVATADGGPTRPEPPGPDVAAPA